MFRSIGAVAAGYVVFAVSAVLLYQLSGQAPHQVAPPAFQAASIIWGAVFALVGGWLTAHVAGKRPATHAAILAGVIALGALASLIAQWNEAHWSQLAAIVVMAPCAWGGGLLARRTARTRELEAGRR
jgi:hypothetical protein